MGATSFVRMDVPPLIVSMLPALAKLHPGVLREESESREERRRKPSRPRRSPSPQHIPSQAPRACTIGALGIQRWTWRYVASFAGVGTMLEVALRLGGELACGWLFLRLRLGRHVFRCRQSGDATRDAALRHATTNYQLASLSYVLK